MSQLQPPNPLSDDDARQLAEHLSLVTQSGLPMAPALRAAAKELPNRRLAQALERLAIDLESGQSLQHILESNPRFLPQYMRQLIETGCRSGNLPEVLVQLVDIDRTSAELKRSLRLAITYPILLIVLWGALVIFLAVNVVPALAKVLQDFKTTLPWSTHFLLQISGPGILTLLAFLAAAIPMVILALKVSLRPLGWQHLLAEIPLYGPTLLWRGVAIWSRLLGLLLKQGLPLPEAIRLASEGIYSPLIALDGLRVAKMVTAGRKFADAINTVPNLPASLLPLVRWGEDHNSLPAALDTAAEMFENRVKMRAVLMQSILPPLVFIAAAAGALWIVNAMLMPLYHLYYALTVGFSNRSAPLWTESWDTAAIEIVIALAATWLLLIMLVGFNRAPLGIFLSRLFGGTGRPARTGFRAQLRDFLRRVNWILTFILLFVALTVLAGPLGFLLWLATVIIAISLRVRYGQTERRVLLWLLAVAVEKGIPLPEAAQAFADERYDKLGIRAHRLAIALGQGLPLDRALAVTNIRLPSDALVAVRTGCATGGLAPLLKNAARHAAAIDAAVQDVVGRIVYLLMFVLFTSLVITFIQIRIVPAFQKIFADFHQQLPPVSLAMIRSFYLPMHFPTVAVLLFVILFTLLFVFFYTLARYTGLFRGDPPLVRRLALPLDGSLILRSLAESAEAHKPLDAALWVLAKHYPKRYIRRRLRRAAELTDGGTNWCDSLHSVGLLTPADNGLLKASERVGNLPWAMNGIADRLVRRFSTRMLAIMSVSYPLVIFAFGAVVFFIGVGLIFPLAQLILHLA